MLERKELEQFKLVLPEVPEKEGNEVEMESIAKSLTKLMHTELDKILNYAGSRIKMNKEQIESLKKFYQKLVFFEINEKIHDAVKYNRLCEKNQKEHVKWFDQMEKINNSGCAEYEMKYAVQSELYQFFHEDPEKRTERIEGPMRKKLEKIEDRIDDLEKDFDKVRSFVMKFDKDKVNDNILLFIDEILKNSVVM